MVWYDMVWCGIAQFLISARSIQNAEVQTKRVGTVYLFQYGLYSSCLVCNIFRCTGYVMR
jgi:hypothetical protein